MNSNSINNSNKNITVQAKQKKIKISELMTDSELNTLQHSLFLGDLHRSKTKILNSINMNTNNKKERDIFKKEKKFYELKLEKAEMIANFLNK
jgi:oligoribonuclease (3'-5' exoribonuclease)